MKPMNHHPHGPAECQESPIRHRGAAFPPTEPAQNSMTCDKRTSPDGPEFDRTVGFLRTVPGLARISEGALELLAMRVAAVHLRPGQWIIREGELADSMFIVRTGRVEVVDERPPETVIRVLRRGELFGELALLRRSRRSVSVRAARDVDLLALGRADFEALIADAPDFALGVTRTMAAQLAGSRAPVTTTGRPRTIAVVGLEDEQLAASVAEELATALTGHGTVALLAEGEPDAIDQAARCAERVVLRADGMSGEWTELCLAEADFTIAVSGGHAGEKGRALAPKLHGCELLVLGRSPERELVEAVQPSGLQVIVENARRPAALKATARRLAGRSLGIVLSGGGARAFAHLGVIEELMRAGLSFDRIAGVSLGAIVAATIASGFTPEAAYDLHKRVFVDRNPANDFVLPVFSLIRGARTRRGLQEVFGEGRIEELPMRFFCLSCDLVARETVVHQTGRVIDAVIPSVSLPGIFPPVATPDGRLLIDGGVMDNLPVAAMAKTREGPVIAVDVTARQDAPVAGSGGASRASPRRRGVRLGHPLRRTLTGSEAPIPHMAETLVRSFGLGSSDTVAQARRHAALVIAPDVGGVTLLDWKALPRMRELGREAARQVLTANPDLPATLMAG